MNNQAAQSVDGDAFLNSFAPGEDSSAILRELRIKGFMRVSGVPEEFNRPLPSVAGSPPAYQFLIFQSDDATGKRFINMDCALKSGDYLTETPLFIADTVLESLQNALKVADDQCTDALKDVVPL